MPTGTPSFGDAAVVPAAPPPPPSSSSSSSSSSSGTVAPARPAGGRADIVAVVVFVVAVVITVVQPLLARDVDAARFVAALAAERALVQPGDTVLVHPPWRDDVVTALRAAAVVPAATRVTEALAPRHGEPLPPLVVVADDGWPLPAVLARARPAAPPVVVDGVRVFRLPGGSGSASSSSSSSSSSPSSSSPSSGARAQ
jgi:uncharacterized membrane protein YgcG